MDDSYAELVAIEKRAFLFISEALNIDEKFTTSAKTDLYRKGTAADLYRKGTNELERGAAFDVARVADDKRERAVRLVDKMRDNLARTNEQLAFIERALPPKKPRRPASAVGCEQRQAAARARAAAAAAAPAAALKSSRSLSPRPRRSVKPPAEGASAEARVRAVKGVDAKLAHLILDQVLEKGSSVRFDDVSGLEAAKRAVHEAVVLPALNPSLFTGLREPVHGLLLFGPPGNGKSLLARAIASEAHSTFFNISAAALTSKWVGEAEKLVKALFAMARQTQPAIIFIDEVDSVLCERGEKEHEASRRLKTEFLLQFDGAGSASGERLLVIGATNRPFELDPAVIRRFPKRVYVPLPDERARVDLLRRLLRRQAGGALNAAELRRVAQRTDGYSSADLTQLAKEAAYMSVREMSTDTLKKIKPEQLRPISAADLDAALARVRPSVNGDLLGKLDRFNSDFGENSAN